MSDVNLSPTSSAEESFTPVTAGVVLDDHRLHGHPLASTLFGAPAASRLDASTRLVVMVRMPRATGARKARFRQRLATAVRIASHPLRLKWDESARSFPKGTRTRCDFGNF